MICLSGECKEINIDNGDYFNTAGSGDI